MDEEVNPVGQLSHVGLLGAAVEEFLLPIVVAIQMFFHFDDLTVVLGIFPEYVVLHA